MSVNRTPRIQLVSFQECAQQIKAVRQSVFVDELGIDPELEWDDQDDSAQYAIAIVDTQVIAVGRLSKQGKIGRMAVLPDWRKRGIGSQLLQCLIQAAIKAAYLQLHLSSQLDAVAFYRKLGFQAEGPQFMAAGIPHQAMSYPMPSHSTVLIH
jgi:predicted GNAT family N-acyltransferase